MRKFFWSRETEVEAAPTAQLNRPFLLAERMAGGALPLPEALHYAILTAEALREVHARGRVYASLQPAGISIDRAILRKSGRSAFAPPRKKFGNR
jgi:hypothetical protein